jgi:hypothetical protein
MSGLFKRVHAVFPLDMSPALASIPISGMRIHGHTRYSQPAEGRFWNIPAHHSRLSAKNVPHDKESPGLAAQRTLLFSITHPSS